MKIYEETVNVFSFFVIFSQWGHDFRPDYGRLGLLRDTYPEVPLMALSATVTQRMEKKITEKLKFNDDYMLSRKSLSRPNLKYMVKAKSSSTIDEIMNFILQFHREESGIVYCITQNDSEIVADKLIKVIEFFCCLSVYFS